MAQVYSTFVSFDDDSFAFVTLTALICSGVCVVDADNTLKSEKNRQESGKRNSRVNHLVTYYKPQARFSGDCDVHRRDLRIFLKGEAPSSLPRSRF